MAQVCINPNLQQELRTLFFYTFCMKLPNKNDTVVSGCYDLRVFVSVFGSFCFFFFIFFYFFFCLWEGKTRKRLAGEKKFQQIINNTANISDLVLFQSNIFSGFKQLVAMHDPFCSLSTIRGCIIAC